MFPVFPAWRAVFLLEWRWNSHISNAINEPPGRSISTNK